MPRPEEQRNIHHSQEIRLDPERHSTIHGLLEVRDEGRNVGQFVVDQVAAGKRLVVMGEPGSGKTTLIGEVIDALETSGRKVNRSVSFYDEHLAKAEQQWSARDEWTPEIWKAFNEQMYQDLGNANFVEFPAVGKKDPRDRGVTTFEMMAQDAADGIGPDTVFMFVTCNRFLQMWSGLLRQHILEQAPENVLSELAKFNLQTKGIPAGDKGGVLIQGLFRRMGQLEHMKTIRGEELEKIGAWLDQETSDALRESAKDPNVANPGPYDIYNEKIAGMRKPPHITGEMVRGIYADFGIDISRDVRAVSDKVAGDMVEAALQQAADRERLFREDYGLDKNRAIIVHNPFNSAPKVIDLSLIKSLTL